MAAKRGFRVRLSTPNTGCLSGRPRRGSTKGGLVVLRRVGDHIRGHVVGYIALFVALSGGVAYAQLGRTITSSEIKNDTIRAADLNYPVGGDAVTTNKVVAVTGSFRTISHTTLSVNDKGGLGVAQAAVEISNDSGTPADVQIRLQHQGHAAHTATFTETVPAGAMVTVPATFVCKLPAGKQTILLQVSEEGGTASILDTTLTAQDFHRI
jgi:hypothetical protein